MRNDNLGEYLKARRVGKRLTLVQLSELTDVDTSYLGRIETGKRFPSANVLQKIAEPLGYGDAEILKLAGYLSPDRTDERVTEIKEALKGEVKTAMSNLLERVDTL